MELKKGAVRLFCCGGGGVNVGARFEKYRSKPEQAFATIEPVYIDTSGSNLDKMPNIPKDYRYTYKNKDLDGSGKVRRENSDVITDSTRDILQQHPPLDLNIVLSTAAGGSGSVIAPSLVSALLERELPTVVLAIGSADNRLETENTLNTLKSYEGIAQKRKAPVVMFYVENSDQLVRTQADAKIEDIIMGLCILFSRENKELDSRDLFNWLRFDRVTTFPVQLAALTMINSVELLSGKEANFSDFGNVISVATVARDVDNTRLPVMPEYHCIGFVDETAPSNLVQHTPLHFVVTDGYFHGVANKLQGTLRKLTEAQQARLSKKSLLDSNDRMNDDGLVL